MVYPPADGHPSNINRARRRVTSLIRRTTLTRIAALVLDAAYVAWSLCLCVFTSREPCAKTDESIEMSFVVWPRGAQETT